MSLTRSANGKGWRARLKYRGHLDSKTFSRKADAQRWLNEQRAEIDRGKWLDPNRARVRVGELVEPWIASRDIEGSSRRNDRAVYRAYVGPRFGSMPVGDLTSPMVRTWVSSLHTRRGPAAARTKRDALRVLRGIFAYAVEDGRITRNPASGIKVSGTKRTPGQALSVSELRAFVAALEPEGRDVATVLAFSGLRWSELAALDERDVWRDGERVFLAIRKRRVLAEDGTRVTLPGTKGGREVFRTVPLLPEVSEIVHRHLTGRLEGPLFTGPRGGRLISRDWRRQIGWAAGCQAIGRPGLRPHDLRHTAATMWLRATGDVKAVQALLGHSQASMTLDLYAHLLTDSLSRATDLMAAALAEGEQGQNGDTRPPEEELLAGEGRPQKGGDLGFRDGRGDRI